MAEGASVGDRVKEVIVRALGLGIEAAEIADDEVLFGGGVGADSVATLEIVFALEEEFGFEVDDDELRVELFDSVGSLAEYVEARLGNAAAQRPARRPGRRGGLSASETGASAPASGTPQDVHAGPAGQPAGP